MSDLQYRWASSCCMLKLVCFYVAFDDLQNLYIGFTFAMKIIFACRFQRLRAESSTSARAKPPLEAVVALRPSHLEALFGLEAVPDCCVAAKL